MAERAGDRQGSMGMRFEARCAWCGPVAVERAGLGMHLGSGSQALVEYTCARCSHVNVRPLRRGDVAALALAGVHSADGAAPFELLEERTGPPISWDDILDFHQGLTGWEWHDDRWSELETAPAVLRTDEMRDAA